LPNAFCTSIARENENGRGWRCWRSLRKTEKFKPVNMRKCVGQVGEWVGLPCQLGGWVIGWWSG